MKTYTREEAIKLMKANPRGEWNNPILSGMKHGKIRWNDVKDRFEFDCNEEIVDDAAWASLHEIDAHLLSSPDGWYPMIPLPESEWIECKPEDATHVMCNGVYTVMDGLIVFTLRAIGATFHRKKPVEPVIVTVEAVQNPLYTATLYEFEIPNEIDRAKPFKVTFTQEEVK